MLITLSIPTLTFAAIPPPPPLPPEPGPQPPRLPYGHFVEGLAAAVSQKVQDKITAIGSELSRKDPLSWMNTLANEPSPNNAMTNRQRIFLANGLPDPGNQWTQNWLDHIKGLIRRNIPPNSNKLEIHGIVPDRELRAGDLNGLNDLTLTQAGVRPEGFEVRITSSLRNADNTDELQNADQTDRDLYRLLTAALHPCYCTPVVYGLHPDLAPWGGGGADAVHSEKRPFVTGGDFWGWRGDSRNWDDLTNGFQDYHSWLTAAGGGARTDAERSIWQAIVQEEQLHLQDCNLPVGSEPVWYRYRQRDLCTEKSIAIATRFEDAAVFPWLAREGLTYYTSKPSKWQQYKVYAARGTGACLVPRPANPPEITYVYGVRIPQARLCDTAVIQKREGAAPWAEVSVPSVPRDQIRIMLEVERWPENPSRDAGGECRHGWLRLRSPRSLYTSTLSEAGVPDEVWRDALTYWTGVWRYDWTASSGRLARD